VVCNPRGYYGYETCANSYVPLEIEINDKFEVVFND
jgi:hypothetical protein